MLIVSCWLTISPRVTSASVFVAMFFVACIPAFAKFREFRKTCKRSKREVDTEHRSQKKLSEKFRQLINKIGETSQGRTLLTRALNLEAYQFSLCFAFCKYYANLFFHKKRAQEKGEQKTRRDLETHWKWNEFFYVYFFSRHNVWQASANHATSRNSARTQLIWFPCSRPTSFSATCQAFLHSLKIH